VNKNINNDKVKDNNSNNNEATLYKCVQVLLEYRIIMIRELFCSSFVLVLGTLAEAFNWM
jgi:hypothetical protein